MKISFDLPPEIQPWIRMVINSGRYESEQDYISELIRIDYARHLIIKNSAPENDIAQTVEIVKLTKREHEVGHFLTKGLSNKEISRSLNIEVVTVKLHIRNICRKLKVNNRTQAALRLQLTPVC